MTLVDMTIPFLDDPHIYKYSLHFTMVIIANNINNFPFSSYDDWGIGINVYMSCFVVILMRQDAQVTTKYDSKKKH